MKRGQVKIAQTLAGTWVITLPNPEERYEETEVAVFHQDNPASRTMAAAAALSLSGYFGRELVIESHCPHAKADMRTRINFLAQRSK